MKASDIPVGGRFTLPGDETVYTAFEHYSGPTANNLVAYSFNPRLEVLVREIFAGHTEVIAHPPTTAGLTDAG